MDLSSKEYQDKLRKAWEHFIQHDEYDYSFIRPEVLKSWERSRSTGINPYAPNRNVLSASELNIRINANLDLIDVVHPYMENLYSIVKGSNFYILLSDKDGYVIDLIGDPDIVGYSAEHSSLMAGANRSEAAVGTNGAGTPLHEKKPIQLYGAEHYLWPHKDYVGAGAPFYDSDGNIQGCLALAGISSDAHPHTLGMVISAADGITKELSIQKAYDDIKLISAQRNSIIESITSGLILLSKNNRVIQINRIALEMFSMKYENIIGKNIFDYLVFDEQTNPASQSQLFGKELYNKETTVALRDSDTPPIRLNMSINFVKDGNGENNGMVLRFNEPSVINSLVNTISGFKAKYNFDSIIGSSDATQKMIAECKKAAQIHSNVLILGDSGTGKELIAQAIHNAGSCSCGPFIAVNCASLPKSLVESELFGYEKGAFTGANKSGNPGKFELADGGTIFLDEIGDMPLEVQASLLRVIQTKEVVRIGGKYPKPINVRVIAATNKNLNQAVAEKSFREDLYYRLNVFAIYVPTLAQRGDDICQLADYFCRQYARGREIRISDEVYEIFRGYHWPGNIRQLENVIERAVNITDTGIITPEELPPDIMNEDFLNVTPARAIGSDTVTPRFGQNSDLSSASVSASEPASASVSAPARTQEPTRIIKERNEKERILQALKDYDGNMTDAAEALGISRRTIYRKLEKYGIDAKAYRGI